jgi:hypothetical protein
MPHRDAISTKWVILAIAMLGATFSRAAGADEDAVLRAGLDRMYRMEYATAEETLLKGLPPESPPRWLMAGAVCFNRFLDWGDTVSLRRAEMFWEELSPRGEASKRFRAADPERLRLYRGLAGFQLSYAASLRGQPFRSAALALAARQQLASPAPLAAPEARASLMLYAYYRSRVLEKLPFVGAADVPVAAFSEAAGASPVLREIFLASLFWIHIDHKRFGAANAIAADFLGRYPGNRLMREMRGAALYYEGNFAGARAEYDALREEYALIGRIPGRLPLGYYRATGNLARIHNALGNRREAEARLAEWNRAGSSAAAPWLPGILKRDLARL